MTMIGKTVTHYRITGEIGRGGMGVVYRAEDTQLRRDVAVKFLPSALTHDPALRRRFLQEARIASALDHANICTVHDVGETADGRMFIVMAYYDGETLAVRLRRGALPVEQSLRITGQVAAGLARAHEAGIVHRDIKPANVIITARDEIKILDFGLAKLGHDTELTQPGTLIGTVSYMSPEQAGGTDVDHRTDIWALGIVFYEMLTGRRPYQGNSVSETLRAIVLDGPRLDFPEQSGVSRPIADVVRNMLAKDRQRRYPQVRNVLDDLDRLAASSSSDITVTELVLPVPPSRRSVLVLPFSNLSPGDEGEYFSDGLTEEIITDLSDLQTLRVISRTSAQLLKGSRKTLREIAGELDVEYVLEGSVRRSGTQLRVTAKLIEAATDTTLWAHKYGGSIEDVFAIQESISREIVGALRLQLSDSEHERLADHPIADVRAYDCYLRAKHEFLRYSESGLRSAEEALIEARDAAGDNEVILAALGHVYWQYVNAGISDDPRYLRQAHDCADRILAIAPASPHGRRLLGMLLMHDGDLQQAFRLFRQVLADHPNDTETLVLLIPCYGFVGRPYAGSPWVDRLLDVDPLPPMHQFMPGLLALMAGIFDRARTTFEKSHHMDPGNPLVQLTYGQALALNEEHDEAIAVFTSMERDFPGTFFTALGQAYRYALSGDPAGVRAAVTPEIAKIAAADLYHAWNLAQCYALLEERDEALDWLERASSRGLINHPLLSRLDPFLKSIRRESRFEELMQRVKSRWENFEF